MKKNIIMLLSLSATVAMGVFLSSCGKDDPPAKAKLSLTGTATTFSEAAGTIQLEINLDKAASKDFNVEYTLKGTAVEISTVDTTKYAYDYKDLTKGKAFVKKGEKVGVIELELISDPYLENTETIQIKLISVDNDAAELTRVDDLEISITQEDGLLIGLEWGVGTGEKYTDVDMDLILWAEDGSSQLTPTRIASARESYTSPEALFLPTVVFPDGKYGLSCVYYEGSVEPMNFKVTFIEYVNGKQVSTLSKLGQYTLKNINADWANGDETAVAPLLAVTYRKSGTDYLEFSNITVNTTGSRVSTSTMPTIKRGDSNFTNFSQYQRTIKRLK